MPSCSFLTPEIMIPFSYPFSAGTWARVSIWLLIGVIVYAVYGRTHSSLRDVIYVPVTRAEKRNKYSREVVA